MSDLTTARADFVGWVRRQLVGPFGGSDEVIADPPNRRYLMGILFPRQITFEDYAQQEEGEIEETDGPRTNGPEDVFADDPVATANDYLPASQGLSFFTSSSRLRVVCRGARYETLEGKAAATAIEEVAAQPVPTERPEDAHVGGRRPRTRVWRRRPIEESVVDLSPDGPVHVDVLDGHGALYCRWRGIPGGGLVTLTLANAEIADDNPDLNWDKLLLQVELMVDVVDDGEILEYPNFKLRTSDPEETELRLLYRHARTYAVGHGCATDWHDKDGRVVAVRTEVMPEQIVPRIAAREVERGDVLRLAHLADPDLDVATLANELTAFVDEYDGWAAKQRIAIDAAPKWARDAAAKVCERIETVIRRMRDGVAVLSRNGYELEAFRLANTAMLLQMEHATDERAGLRRTRRDPLGPVPEKERTWHAFQLAYCLLTVASLTDDHHPDRGIVDLIWFPTGGGKTEAYLLVAATEIFHRRLVHGDRGAGTSVISRYTLSLLTAQQFQRAATTICACEVLRGRDPDRLGTVPISIGLWVGDTTTPNTLVKAAELADVAKEAEEPENRFLLDRCPWCGTEIMPRRVSLDPDDYGIVATDSSFRFFCPRDDCDFHQVLPVHVVDDDLYRNPPTFLLGTVDKFASLAWEGRSGAFFGGGGRYLRPSLIIQDELHLLSGPLGTTVGVYEAAIHRLAAHDGVQPKVLASTATIRRATDQVRALFGRGVALFPPSGLDARDSFYAQVDETEPGRLYVGLMAQGHTSDTATVHVGATLMQAPLDLALTSDALDAYWTLVAYHNSLRELGRTVTIARDDIPARLDALFGRDARVYDVDELTAGLDRSEQPRLLERLKLDCSQEAAVSFLATTSMLSVGVDVPRLGLMLMNGQPKATAEYIQGTSRVGRAGAPGLIFAMFRATRPRDRSHYESFRPYHSALYRYVEPTSVTPFSPPSRERSLHAGLVILVRHGLGLAADDNAGLVAQRESEVRGLIDDLVNVVERTEPREAAGARRRLEEFLDDWLHRAAEADRKGKRLYYQHQGKGHINLIQDFNRRGDAWATLRSMRNVDQECLVEPYRGGRQ